MTPRLLMSALLLAGQAAQAAPLRDPFVRPPLQAPAPPQDQVASAEAPGALPVLRAIMVDSAQSVANIGGHIVGVGDQVGPYKVVRIDERNVTLLRGRTKNVLVIDKDEGSK